MSELTIELGGLAVRIHDCAGGDPHVILEGKEGHVRINATDVGRLADLLTGASVMMEPEPGKSWLVTVGYPTGQGENGD